MNQQQVPLVKYIKSKEFDALIEEYFHPTEKGPDGNPLFLNKRGMVGRDEWIQRKDAIDKEYKAKMQFFDTIFKMLDGVDSPAPSEAIKPKKKVKKHE